MYIPIIRHSILLCIIRVCLNIGGVNHFSSRLRAHDDRFYDTSENDRT